MDIENLLILEIESADFCYITHTQHGSPLCRLFFFVEVIGKLCYNLKI